MIIFLSGSLQATYTVRLWFEGKEADFAYFLTPEETTVERLSSIAFGFMSLVVGLMLEVL